MADLGDGHVDQRAELERLRQELGVEKAGAAHWRDVARRREDALAELKQRTSVRALLSIERRTSKLRAAALRSGASARRRVRALTMAGSAIPRVVDATARRQRLDDLVADIDRSRSSEAGGTEGVSAFGEHRSMVVVVLGVSSMPSWLDPLTADGVRVALAEDDAAAAAIIGESAVDLVGLVAATTEPLTAQLWVSLAQAVTGDVAAATGVLVHPERRLLHATPHDLLVRSAGYSAELGPDGTAHLTARSAGTEPGRADETSGHSDEHRASPIVAASCAMVVFDRVALERAGGYIATGSPETSVIDLCLRLRRQGDRSVCVPQAMALDHRAVAGPLALARPVDESTPQWRGLIERHGPLLRRSAPGVDPDVVELVITVASPMRKVADRWGDWHLAEALARALNDRGHQAHVQPLDEVASPRGRCADVHLVLRGLARVTRTPGQAHVLWVISHPEDLDDREVDDADLVLVASHRFADALRERTTTPVEVLLQATDAERFRPMPPDPAHHHDVTVVGRSRDVLRPMVQHALEAGLRPAIYGSGWEDLVDSSLVVADHVDNHVLPVVYSSAGVVLNDHWETMRGWGFLSNRVFDVLACGTPVLSDPVPGLFDAVGDLVTTWTTPSELKDAVDAALELDRTAFAARARSLVLSRHTFAHRAAELERALAAAGLVRLA